MANSKKLRLLILVGIILLAIGIALGLNKCTKKPTPEIIREKLDSLIVEDSIHIKTAAEHGDTADYHIDQAIKAMQRRDSILGRPSNYAKQLEELESKISADVRIKRDRTSGD